MTLSQRVPGMRRGAVLRNLAVGFVWTFILLAVVGACLGGAGDETASPTDADSSGGNGDASEGADEPADESGEDTSDSTDSETNDDTDEASGGESNAGGSDESSDGGDAGASYTKEDYSADAGALFEANTGAKWIAYDEFDGKGYVDVTSQSYGSTNELASEMGVIAGTYASYVDNANADAPESLTVFVFQPDGDTRAGQYQIKAEWAAAYNDGSMTPNEFASTVFETIEVDE